jgi:hypothetical protein
MLEFAEAAVATLSTLASHLGDIDHATKSRNEKYTTYKVDSISLRDLLVQHSAPKVIDYISIDTEGSELEILRGFNFEEFDVKIITVEHNYTSRREQLQDLLIKNGFIRIFSEISNCDDWYVNTQV